MATINKIIFGLVVGFFLLTAKQVLAADQIKTVEFYVYDSSLALSSTDSQNFSIYIGDNIGAVTNPIKSAFFKVSGTYTGNGTINLTLDSGNSKTFTLPSVSSPTHFELLYADTSSVIDPASAGTYNYDLGITPSGVTVYGLGVKLTLTYEYIPESCPDGSSEKVKTQEFYVYDSSSALSSTDSQNFSIYIGDNIGAVTNPIKSAFFKVSGTYIGNGTINLTLDSGNSKTFTLPSVSSPTHFELLYADTASIINPASAGTYNYDLGITPSGVTVYGLGAVLDLTFQYVPVSCTGLPPTGELISVVFDTTNLDIMRPAYNSILWKGTLNGGTGRVRFQLATSNNTNGPWSYIGSSDDGLTCNSGSWYDAVAADTPVEISCNELYHNNQRYFRYKIQLCSNNDCLTSGDISPQIDDVVTNWSP